MSEKSVDLNSCLSSLIPCGIGIYEICEGRPVFKYVNARLADILAFDGMHPAGSTENRNVYHEDWDRLVEKTLKLSPGSAICIPARIMRRIGRYKWYRFDIVCTGGKNEHTVYYLTVSNIDQSVHASKNLDILMNNTPCGICGFMIKENRVSIVYSNTYTKTTFDVSATDRIADGDISRLVHPEDREIFEKVKQDTLYGSHEVEFDFRVCTPSGRVIWVHGTNIAIQTDTDEWAVYTAFMDVTKQKIAEQVLTEREAQSRIAINSANLIVWSYNISDESFSFNPDVSRRYSIDIDLLHKGYKAMVEKGYILDESRAEFILLHEKINRGEKKCSAVIHMNTELTNFEWLKIVYTAVYDNENRVIGGVGVGEDVTGLINARRKFDEEVAFRRVIKSNVLASFKINVTENTILDTFISSSDFIEFEHCTTAAELLFTASSLFPAQPLSCSILKSFYKQGKTAFSDDFSNYRDSRQYSYTRRLCHLIKNPERNDIVCFINFEDITHEKIMASITENIISKDYEFAVVVDLERNTARRYLKRSNDVDDLPEEAEEYEFSTISHIRTTANAENVEKLTEAIKIKNIRKSLENNESYSFYYSTVIDGKAMEKQLNFSYLDRETSIVLMTRCDITELVKQQNEQKKRLQKALDDAEQANLAKTDFLSRMSHEIRTPMNAIIGLTKLAKDETNDSGAMEKYLDNIQSSSDYLLGLINDILDVSRIESGKFELHRQWCCVSELLNSVLTMIKPLAAAKNIKFTYPDSKRLNADVKSYIDPMRVRQILINILNNSCKFTDEGGTINFSATNIYLDERHSVDKIIISDNGCGMSESFLEHLGEPFMQEENAFSGSVSGTGLGLTIVKQIVESMGGELNCTSKLGEGTTFSILFPYDYTFEKTSSDESEKEMVTLENMKILVVEDNEINLKICSQLLIRNGAKITSAKNGKLAVEEFEKSPVGYFDCILMDVRMPVMNGIDATIAIRSCQREDAQKIPVIALTADAFTEDMGKTLNAGMNSHLSKPIDADKLYRTIFRFVKKYRKQ